MQRACSSGISRHGTVALLALALIGCSEPDWVATIGTVNLDAERTISMTAPARATAGAQFIVTVQTFGSSNCTRADRTNLSTSGSLARLVPYDEVPAPGSGMACFRDAATFSHSHGVQFAGPGPAKLRVIGYFGQGTEAVLDSVEVGIEVDP
jgi:hypothetical protein